MYFDDDGTLNSCFITLKGNCQKQIFPPSQHDIKKLFFTSTILTGFL